MFEQVFLVANRRIIRQERRGKALYKQKRPQSRTIAKVHEAYLEDLIWPHDVVGQKTVRPKHCRLAIRQHSVHLPCVTMARGNPCGMAVD